MKKVRFIAIVSLLVLAALAAGSASGQIFTPKGTSGAAEPLILIDASAFAVPGSDSIRLELYYQIYNFGLQFKEDNNEWVAKYEVSAAVLDKDQVQVGAQEKAREIRLATSERTKSKFDHRTS